MRRSSMTGTTQKPLVVHPDIDSKMLFVTDI
jgi:hypothetical protein